MKVKRESSNVKLDDGEWLISCMVRRRNLELGFEISGFRI